MEERSGRCLKGGREKWKMSKGVRREVEDMEKERREKVEYV